MYRHMGYHLYTSLQTFYALIVLQNKKKFGQTQQQVTRSLCNLGKRGYRINYVHSVGLFYPRLIMLHVTVRSA